MPTHPSTLCVAKEVSSLFLFRAMCYHEKEIFSLLKEPKFHINRSMVLLFRELSHTHVDKKEKIDISKNYRHLYHHPKKFPFKKTKREGINGVALHSGGGSKA